LRRATRERLCCSCLESLGCPLKHVGITAPPEAIYLPRQYKKKKKIPKPRQLTLYSQFISIVVRTIVRYLSSHIEAVCPKEAVSELLGEKKIVSSTPGEYQCRKKAEITFTLRWCGGVCYRKPRTFGASWPLPWNRAITHYTYSILSIFSSTHKRSRNICVRSEF